MHFQYKNWKSNSKKIGSIFIWYHHKVPLNPLTARIPTVFGHLLEDRVLHKEACVAKLLGTHLSVQVHEKVKFSGRDISSLAVKGLSAWLLVPFFVVLSVKCY